MIKYKSIEILSRQILPIASLFFATYLEAELVQFLILAYILLDDLFLDQKISTKATLIFLALTVLEYIIGVDVFAADLAIVAFFLFFIAVVAALKELLIPIREVDF